MDNGRRAANPLQQTQKDHLQAIINDGYRSENILAEAKKRKMRVPKRLVDKLSPDQELEWIELGVTNHLVIERVLKLAKKHLRFIG